MELEVLTEIIARIYWALKCSLRAMYDKSGIFSMCEDTEK